MSTTEMSVSDKVIALAKPCANCGRVFLDHAHSLFSSVCPGYSYTPTMLDGIHLDVILSKHSVALEVARGALGSVADCGCILSREKLESPPTCCCYACIASRALTAIDAVTGGAAGVENSSLREASGRKPGVPSGPAPAAVANPRETTSAVGAGSRQGTPGAEEAGELSFRQMQTALMNIGFDLSCGGCASLFYTGHSETHDHGCKTTHVAVTPVAQRRPAREVANKIMEALGFRYPPYQVGLVEAIVEADRRGEP